MKKIIYTRPDGGVSIIIPAPKEQLEKSLGPMTKEQYESIVRSRSIPEGAVNVRYIEDEDIPNDRVFRDAWVYNGRKIDIDRDKVREHIRSVRNKSLEKLDFKATTEARKPNGNVTDIDNKASVLRDMTLDSRFNSDDINELKEILEEVTIND